MAQEDLESDGEETPSREDRRKKPKVGPGTQLRNPNFIGIGVQKAGTTWLYENLSSHPRVWTPPIKELHYFNTVHLPTHREWAQESLQKRGLRVLKEYLAATKPADRDDHHMARIAEMIAAPVSDRWYRRIFANAGAEQICGEITPAYSLLPPEGIDHVLKLCPNAKILLALRDPIERAWSQIRMYSRKAKNIDQQRMLRVAQSGNVVDRAEYGLILEQWTERVPKRNFMVVFMDDIAERPDFVLRKLCNFLSIEHDASYFPQARERVFEGGDMAGADIPPDVYAALKENMRPTYEAMCRFYPEVGKKWMDRHY